MSTTTVAPPVTGHVPARPWSAALLERVRTWSYYRTADIASRRDLRLDFLRGFCAFAMIIDHMGGASFLYPLTGGNRFFVSAAEGFIFLSEGGVDQPDIVRVYMLLPSALLQSAEQPVRIISLARSGIGACKKSRRIRTSRRLPTTPCWSSK